MFLSSANGTRRFLVPMDQTRSNRIKLNFCNNKHNGKMCYVLTKNKFPAPNEKQEKRQNYNEQKN